MFFEVVAEYKGGWSAHERNSIPDEDGTGERTFPPSLYNAMKYLECGDSIALLSKERTVTYSELFCAIDGYSRLITPETRGKVAIYSENRPEWVYTLYAGWKSGCTVVPIDYMSPADEVAYILEDCSPGLIFCSRRKLRELEKAMLSLSSVPRILVFEECEAEYGTGVRNSFQPLERDDEDIALIIYTSGTTGSPKGAMISFSNILANVKAVSEAAPIFTPDSRVLVLLPVHHVLPLGGTILAPLFVGACCVFSPSIGSRDILETLQLHGVTVIVAVPRFYSMLMKGIREKIQENHVARTLFSLAKRIDSPALSRLLFRKVHQRFGGKIRFLVCGGAAIDDEVAKDFKALGFDMLTGYGMTETAPLISFTHPGTLRIGASGYVCPEVEVRIDDGEITVRGRHVMKGYYKRPEETAAMIRDGWLHTGDLGHVDSDGFLFVTGRKKDIIVLSNGKNVNPEEIEAKILAGFDAVKEIAVCLHNDMLHAVIFPDFEKLSKRGVHALDDYFRWEVVGEYNQRVASTKKIMKFTLVKEELPKTRLGKIRRFQIPELIAKPHLQGCGGTEPDSPVYLKIKSFLSEQGGKTVFAGAHLEIDMGMDSLDKVAFAAFLHSSFGVKIGDEEYLQHPTVGAIADYVERTKVKIEEEGLEWKSILREDAETNLPRRASSHIPLGKMVRFLLRRIFRISAVGLENIPPHPFILVSNHQSYLDGLMIGTSLDVPVAGRLYFYASEQTFGRRWQRDFISRHNVILVDVNRSLKLSLQRLARVLKNGDSLVIFPEGGLTRDGKVQPFKKTFAILSKELNVPVVPVVLQGAYEAMPRGKRIPKFGHSVGVEFLPPVYPEAFGYEELTEKVRRKITGGMESPPALEGAASGI